MSRTLGVIVASLVTLSFIGCQAPRWATSGPASYKDKRTNTALFRGYSGVCTTPQEASRKAQVDAVAQATNYVFEGVKVADLYTPEARALPGFAELEKLLRDSVSQSLYKEFSEARTLVDFYNNERRDKLEVTFDTFYLYEIPRTRLADVIREAELVVKLHIYVQGPGAAPENRRKLANESSQALEHLADEILRSW